MQDESKGHERLPKASIYLGGPEVSFDPEERLKKFPFLSGVIAGEGEAVMYVLGTKGADAGELETFSQAVSAGEVGIATDSITSNGAAVNLVQMPEGSTSTAEAEDSD